MKYLPLNQSILNTDSKYSFIFNDSNDLKLDFFKYWDVYGSVKVSAYRQYEYQLKILFRQYMNNDIKIDWNY